MSESTRMMLGLVIGIVIMIVLVLKTKIHTFIALLLAALITGLIGGMPVSDIKDAAGKVATTGVITAIKDGFGSTLKSTGIIIGLGVMMGGVLESSGAAEQLAFTFIKAIGKRKEEWALALTGWVVSIPVFADSAIVIFAPLVKAMSSVTGISVISLALSLACGLQMTHAMVPPTPGPLTAAANLNVDVGQIIILGMVVSIPMLIVIVPYCKWVGKKIYQIPNEDYVGLGIVHSMAHPLGAFYGTPHGVANAIILPTVMEYNAEYTGEKFREIAKAFGIKHTRRMAPEEYRKAAVDAVRQLAHDVNIPENLKGIMDIKDLDFIAESVLNDVCTGGNPRDTNLEEIKELYKKLL